MIRAGFAIVATAALALAGCDNLVVVYDPIGDQGYYDGALEYAASRGEVYAEIDGRPFAMPKGRFDTRVTDLMTGANFGPPVTFATRHSERTVKAYKVVMAFNASPALSADMLCADEREPFAAKPGGETLSLLSVFCQHERALSQATGVARNIRGADDPGFRRLVRAVMVSLFPINDGLDDDDDDDKRL